MPDATVDTLPVRLERIGWEPEPFDICWLACEREGFRRTIGHYEICLCIEHILELEAAAEDRFGYSSARPPKGYKGKVWWPWRLIEPDDA